jgi:hypothetical protein
VVENVRFDAVALDLVNSFALQSAAKLANSNVRIDVRKTTIFDFFIRGYFFLLLTFKQ